MEKPCLNDPAVFPDDGVLGCCLGRAKSSWDEVFRFLQATRTLIELKKMFK